jgi:hypothetical protein
MIMSLALIGQFSGPPERERHGTPIEALRKAIKWTGRSSCGSLSSEAKCNATGALTMPADDDRSIIEPIASSVANA